MTVQLVCWIQLLRPSAKKLTLIDARRVMSIYEEAMRRVQLVSGLLEQTSITAVTVRLRTLLGVELTDSLTQYSSVLDVFDEVVSWREMAISDTRSPLALRDRSVASTRDRDDSILTMLFKDEEEPPEIVSYISTIQARSVMHYITIPRCMQFDRLFLSAHLVMVLETPTR